MMKIYLSDSVPPADLGSFLISDGKVYWGVNLTGGTYTLAPRGGSKIISNTTTGSYYCIITYTSPNPPPETVDVQAIVMG